MAGDNGCADWAEIKVFYRVARSRERIFVFLSETSDAMCSIRSLCPSYLLAWCLHVGQPKLTKDVERIKQLFKHPFTL